MLNYVVWVIYLKDMLLDNLGCVSQKRCKQIVETIGANGVYNILGLTALLGNNTLTGLDLTITTSLFICKSFPACL